MRQWKLLLPLVALVLVAAFASVLAQSGGDYDLSWSTVDGGGATFSEGGSYKLGSTIGQPDAGTLQGGDSALGGGFWSGIATIIYHFYEVYLPLIFKNYGP